MHALEAGVPARDDLAGSVGKGDGSAAIDGGVELGAIGEPASVVDGVVTALFSERSGTDGYIDVAESVEVLGSALDLGDVGWVVGGVCGGFGCGGFRVGCGDACSGCCWAVNNSLLAANANITITSRLQNTTR